MWINVDMYITQNFAETPLEDSRPSIAPLVLPTQLDSEDSDSHYEEEQNNNETMCVYTETAAYDEDVVGPKAEETIEEQKVKNDGNQVRVSKIKKNVCILLTWLGISTHKSIC